MLYVRRKNLIGVPSFMAVVLCAVMGVFVSPSQADISDAVTFRFEAITSNDPCNAAIGEQQLFMDVFNNGGYAKFRFRNEGDVHSSITGIWFDDGSLLGIDRIIDRETITDPCILDGHPDVDFERDGNQNLPGGSEMEYPFEAVKGFTVKSDQPPPKWGVESADLEYPDQWVQIEFELQPGQSLANVIEELLTGDPYPTLRVGLHVQSFNGDGQSSESFVNVVPEPATLCLFGLGGLALLRKRRK